MSQLPREVERYWLHPDAYGDIDEITTHIAEETSIDAADRVIEAIFDRILTLLPLEVRH